MANTINILKPSVCFEVQRIVGISTSEGNSKSYQVQWAPSWISGIHLIGCEDLIEQYEHDQKNRELNIKVETVDEYAAQDGVVFDCKDNDDMMQDANQPDDSPEQQLTDSHSNVDVTVRVDETVRVGETVSVMHHVSSHPYTYQKGENYNGDTNVKVVSSGSTFQSNDQENSVQVLPSNMSNPGLQCSQTNMTSLQNSGSPKDGCIVLSFQCDKLICDDSKDTGREDSTNINKVYAASHSKEFSLTDGRKLPQPVTYFNNKGTMHMVANEPISQGKIKTVNKKALICTVCYKAFGDTQKWKIHTAKAHRYKCSLCEKAFRDSTDLKRHGRVHTGEQPFECNVCQKKFRTAYYVKRHLDMQHSQEGVPLHV